MSKRMKSRQETGESADGLPGRAGQTRNPRPYIKVNKRGQLVIPAAVRKALGLSEGGMLHASLDAQGQLVLRRVPA